MKSLIGLVGFIGAGKGSVADIFVEKYGFQKEAFANPVKDAIAAMFSWNRKWLEGDSEWSRAWREKPDLFWSHKFGRPFTPREASQKMGTEVGRDIYHTDLWVDAFERRMNPQKNYVLSDTRFPNEIKKIIELEGIVIRVARGKEPDWYQQAIVANNDKESVGNMTFLDAPHYSEWALCGHPDITHLIENDGTLEELNNSVKKLVDNYIS